MLDMELLSPAGDIETLITAVKAGANSVYFGGKAFNARSFANNFTDEQIAQAVDYCHLHNVNVFVTVNTLVSDKEIEELKKYIRMLDSFGVDGVIVQDFGVAAIVKNIAPSLRLHASTQMTVTDINGAKLLNDYGFKRIVLARELSKEEIKRIALNTEAEIEVFVHGAICVCYSGQCLMSSFIGGRSGNRGKCAQPCRLNYKFDKKEGTYFSLKDMCLIKELKELNDIGVASLKIEGRMKGKDYVKSVVGMYRKYLDNEKSVTDKDYADLKSVFYRGGYTDGYFTAKVGSEMFCYNKPDNPYLKQKEIEISDVINKRGVSFVFVAQTGKKAELTGICDGINITLQSEKISEKAINVPLTAERIRNQLKKLGNTDFELINTEINIDDDISIPISEINNMRRKIIEDITEKITGKYHRDDLQKDFYVKNEKRRDNLSFSAFVENREQYDAVKKLGFEKIYAPIAFCKKDDIAILPRIPDEKSIEIIKNNNIKKVLIRNIGQLYLCNKLNLEIYVDSTMNIYNSYSVEFIEQYNVKQITLSCEMMLSQIRDIKSSVPLESIVYGNLPVMVTKNCLIKGAYKCVNHKGTFVTDRTGTEFWIKCLPDCKNEIFNSAPVVMSDKLNDLKQTQIAYARLQFTTETPEMIEKIYKSYVNNKPLDINFTRGKFYKGV